MKDSIVNLLKTSILMSLILFAAVFTGCKKDDSAPAVKSFEDITYSEIMAKQGSINSSEMEISNFSGLIMKVGDILFYKTSLGNFGKLQIILIDQAENYKITFKAKTYSATGTAVAETNSLDVRGTWLCDLDVMSEGDDDTFADFWNERIDATNTKWVAKNGALFFSYKQGTK